MDATTPARSSTSTTTSSPRARAAPIEIGYDETVTIIGMKGTGKTTLMRVLVNGLRPRVVVWDPLWQYPADVSYKPADLEREELDHVAGQLIAQGGPYALGIEEAEQVLPEGKPLLPAFKRFHLMGRNMGFRSICNTRIPQKLTKDVLDQSDHIIIFKLGGRALDYMRKYLGGTEGRRLRVMRQWVKDPRQGGGRHFWYHDGAMEEREPLRVTGAAASTAPGMPATAAEDS